MSLAQPRGLYVSIQVVRASLLAVRSEQEGLGRHRTETIKANMTPLSRGIHFKATLLFIKNLFYNNVRPEICQNIKNMLRTYPRLRDKQFILSLHPENLVYIMSYMESECM